MAVPHPPTATDIEPLTPDEIARIPSAALPISLQISHLLSEFTRLSVQLFAIISTTSPSLVAGARGSAPTDAVYDALAQIDEKLASLLGMYDAHQQRQRRIEALIGELSRLDSNWRSSALRLEACVAELDPILASGKLDRIAIDRAKEAKVTPDGLLAYARLIAPFTSAPPASLFPPEIKLKGVGATDPTGRTLPPGAIPPFPTEATMRKGRLQFGREGLLQGYLGETEQVGAGAFLPCLAHKQTLSRTFVRSLCLTDRLSVPATQADETRRRALSCHRIRRPPRANRPTPLPASSTKRKRTPLPAH